MSLYLPEAYAVATGASRDAKCEPIAYLPSFSFVADLLYSHLHSKSSPYMPDSYNTEQGLIDYDECQLDIQFRYRLPLKKVRPFVNIGFSNATVFNSGSSYVTDDDAVATPTQITREPVFHTAVGENAFNSYQFGILGGIGVEIRRFILEGRFEKGSSLSGDTHEKAPVSNLSLLAGISF